MSPVDSFKRAFAGICDRLHRNQAQVGKNEYIYIFSFCNGPLQYCGSVPVVD